nr:hypothetical protein BdHM001_21390 [Bdellovibrio sp. HM001]
MKLNLSALFLCFSLLSACTLDLNMREGSSQNSLRPEEDVFTEVLSIDFRAKADNSDISEIYISKDQSQFDYVASIPGYIDFFAADPSSPGNGYAVVVKSPASPGAWPDKVLWFVSAKAEANQYFADLPAGLESCTVFPHKSFINLHCLDAAYEPVAYQIDKASGEVAPLLPRLGYLDDSNYRYQIKSPVFPGSAVDLIEVRKIALADPSDSKLVDLFVYLDDAYTKLPLSGGDLTAVAAANVGDVRMDMDNLLTVFLFDSITQDVNLVIVDVTKADQLLPVRVFAGTGTVFTEGVMDGSLILNVNSTLKSYRLGSGLSTLSYSSNQYLGIVQGRMYYFEPWVFGQPQWFGSCDISGSCQTVFTDAAAYGILTLVPNEQQKIYFVNKTSPEADRVLESTSGSAGGSVVETKLTENLKSHPIPIAKVSSIRKVGNYLEVYYQDPNTNQRAFAILDAETESVLDTFVDYCYAATDEERKDFVLKNHKYREPLKPGLNFIVASFGCI